MRPPPVLTLSVLQSDIFTISEVLSAAECQALVARAEDLGFEPAAVRTSQGPKMMTHIRNNDRVVITDEALAARLWQRVQPVLPVIDDLIATGLDPLWRFYRYVPGQQFKRHKDGAARSASGQLSRLSFLIYLNDDCEGGATVFRDSGLEGAAVPPLVINPVQGQALLFRHQRWHEGTPVQQGVKYVLRSDVFYGR